MLGVIFNLYFIELGGKRIEFGIFNFNLFLVMFKLVIIGLFKYIILIRVLFDLIILGI